MKKNFNYLVVIATVLAVGLSGCSKDDGPAKEIAKKYVGGELAVTNAGETLTGGAATLEAIGDNSVKVTLENIVNGQASFTLNAAVGEGGNGHTFGGTKEMDGMKVTVSGVVKEGKATVDVAVEMAASDLLKSWTYNETGDVGEEAPDFVIFDLQNKSGQLMWGGKEVTTAEYNEYAKGWIQIIGKMALENFSLTFDKNGWVGLSAKSSMAPEGQQELNFPKLARYYYSPSSSMLLFDAPLGESTVSEALGGGILRVPFVCKFENNVLTATVQPEFLSLLLPMIPTGDKLAELLSSLDTLFPPDFAIYAPIIKGIITDLVNGVTDPDKTSFTFGAKLMPLSAASGQ